MNKSQNYPWKMYGDFFLLAGPREEAQAILNEEAVFDGRAVQEVGSGGAYALFYVDWKEDVDSGQWDHLKDRLGRNPRCEAALVLYTGTWYWSEKPLNDRWTGGEWYDDSWDEYAPPWADLLLKGGARTGSLVVRGSEAVQWPTGGGSGDWLEGGTLTVARLAELCNPYVKPVKSREFYQKFRKELPGFDGVSAIELTQVEEKWVGGDDEALARLFKLEGAAKAGDLTRLRYVDSYVSTKTTWLCNLETHEVVKRVLVSIHVPQDPAAGEYRYVNLTLDKREIVCKPLAGIPAGDEADLLWDGGTCRFCFSNRERLVVPAQNPDTGEAAQGVGDMCFQGVDQVKRVVLPNTVTVLGTGAFSGCKKLEYVSFQDDPDSKADFVLRKKGDLLALFTKKTAYEIPKDVTKIGKFAFSSCNKLKSVTLHGKLKPLLKDSLAGCKSLKTVVLQPDVKAVEWLALARGNIQAVVLADGTRVHLNSESRLRYPLVFNSSERRVFLEGEAYFEVMRDEEHPFIVEMGDFSVDVLGTSFDVSNYQDDEENGVVLVEGSVRVNKDGQEYLLKPNEELVIKENDVCVRKVNARNAISWKNDKFYFNDETLDMVMKTLVRWYDVEVVFANQKVRGYHFSGFVPKYADITKAFEILELTCDIKFVLQNRTVIITQRTE